MTRREIMLAAWAALAVLRAGTATAQGALLPTPGTPADPAADPADPAAPPLQAAWAAWKTACMTDDGRVIDQLQRGASHSESQGYGLLLAATMGDAAAFDAIDAWTTRYLAIRPDALLAWRWLPDQAVSVPDLNNASDGDLFYAWALVRAADTLQRPALIDRARRIATDLAAACLVPHPDGSDRLVFTPAAAGFQRDDGLVINPSYIMPLAMQDIASATGVDAWRDCAADSVTLLADLAAAGLMPDWIALQPSGAIPATDLSANNGYDALRVPLMLIWSGYADHPAVTGQARAYAGAGIATGGTPTVMERSTGRVLEISPDPGYLAVSELVACATGTALGSFIPPLDTRQPYYPATLHLMTLLAQTETVPRCVPL